MPIAGAPDGLDSAEITPLTAPAICTWEQQEKTTNSDRLRVRRELVYMYVRPVNPLEFRFFFKGLSVLNELLLLLEPGKRKEPSTQSSQPASLYRLLLRLRLNDDFQPAGASSGKPSVSRPKGVPWTVEACDVSRAVVSSSLYTVSNLFEPFFFVFAQ